MLATIQSKSDNPWAQIQTLFSSVILFLVAYDVMRQLPGLATSLAGGMYFHATTIGQATFGAAMAYGAAAGRAGQAAVAGAVSGGGARRGQRAPAGPSLSGATP